MRILNKGLGTKPKKISREEIIKNIEQLISEHDIAYQAWYAHRYSQ